MPRCLVFASKEVGFACLSHVIAAGETIIHVFVGSANDVEILDLCRARQISHSVTTAEDIAAFVRKGERVDWLLNFWSPFILKQDILALATRRLNVHPGLVPHCKGNDAAAWAIRNALPAGVSLIEMQEGIDVGHVYAQQEVAYSDADTGRSLHERLVKASSALFINEWNRLRTSKEAPRPQANGGSYFTRKQTNADRVKQAQEKMTLGEVATWARAHDFSPGTTAEIVLEDGVRYAVHVKKPEPKP